MNKAQETALKELQDIQLQLQELSQRADEILEKHFPDEVVHASAYQVTAFGWSSNPYDSTFATTVKEIEEKMQQEDEEEMEDE